MTLPAASSLHPETPTAAWKPQPLSSADVRYATWIAFFAWVFAVYDFILFGTLLPVMGGHFNWSEAEQAELATWVALGGAIIAFAIGPLVDRIGRRGGIIVTIGGTALCSALTALCELVIYMALKERRRKKAGENGRARIGAGLPGIREPKAGPNRRSLRNWQFR